VLLHAVTVAPMQLNACISNAASTRCCSEVCKYVVHVLALHSDGQTQEDEAEAHGHFCHSTLQSLPSELLCRIAAPLNLEDRQVAHVYKLCCTWCKRRTHTKH
jgi:hypothetical protein